MSSIADIFIPTTKSTASLKACLDSLVIQTRKDFHILLVGLQKEKEVERLLQNYPQLSIEYFAQKKTGLVQAANEGLGKAEHDFFIRIDDDVVVDREWFRNIVETFSQNQKIGAVTGPTIITKERRQGRDLIAFLTKCKDSKNPFYKVLYWLYYEYLYEGKMYEMSQFLKSGVFTLGSNFEEYIPKENVEVNNIEACNFAVRTNILKQLGGFDKTFARGLGDYHEADIAFKVAKNGYTIVYNPQVKVWHNIEQDDRQARPDAYYRIQNCIVFYRRHIKIDSFDKFCRFSTNLLLQNCYYIYKFLRTGKVDQLGAIPGSIVGLLRGTK